MVVFKVKANASGQYYLPKEVRAELGTELVDILTELQAQMAVRL